MKLVMSDKNRERVLSEMKRLINGFNASQNRKPTSSGKKLINAFLLLPIIVTTAITATLTVCTFFFLNAVDPQKDDSKLSKVAKYVAKSLICVAAAVVLIPCIVLTAVVSFIPFLTLLALWKYEFNQENIEDRQIQAINEVEVDGETEYDERTGQEVKLMLQHSRKHDQTNTDSHQPLINNSSHEPAVEVISRKMDDKQASDDTVIAKNIIRENDEIIVRAAMDANRCTIAGPLAGYLTDKQKGFAATFGLQCEALENEKGLDFQMGFKLRTGANKEEAKQVLKRSGFVQPMPSSASGILPMQKFRSARF